MMSLLRLLWRICLLRAGPEDLPYSPALTRGLVVLGVGADLIFVSVLEAGRHDLMRVALSLLLLLGLPWLLLASRGLQARYAQTLAAFAGTGVIFTFAFLPLALQAVDLPRPDPDVAPTREQLIVGWLSIGLFGWKLALNGHIWKQALDWPRTGGVLLALGIFLLELGLLRALLGTPE
jgi:hypothetical protein